MFGIRILGMLHEVALQKSLHTITIFNICSKWFKLYCNYFVDFDVMPFRFFHFRKRWGMLGGPHIPSARLDMFASACWCHVVFTGGFASLFVYPTQLLSLLYIMEPENDDVEVQLISSSNQETRILSFPFVGGFPMGANLGFPCIKLRGCWEFVFHPCGLPQPAGQWGFSWQFTSQLRNPANIGY